MADSLLLGIVDVRQRIRDTMKVLGMGQNQLARRMGITNGHMSRILSGEKEPGEKVLFWLGLEAVTRYRPLYLSDQLPAHLEAPSPQQPHRESTK